MTVMHIYQKQGRTQLDAGCVSDTSPVTHMEKDYFPEKFCILWRLFS
jgi:hypothetical protein